MTHLPSHVKFFYWLSIAVVVIWVFRQVQFWIPVTPYITGLGRDYVETAIIGALETLLLCTATLIAAWLAARRHNRWARWAFVGLFLFREIVLFLKRPDLMTSNDYLRAHFSNPAQLAVTLPLLAACILIFIGNARPWFEPSRGA